MSDQKEANPALSFNNPYLFWLAMHQAVKAVDAAKAFNEPDQQRMERLRVVASQKFQEHQVSIDLKEVKAILEKDGYSCDTFEQMRSLFAPAGLSVSLGSHASNSIAGYLALCIQTNPTEMQSDFKSVETDLKKFDSKSATNGLYLAGYSKGSRMLNHIPYRIEELDKLLARYIALAHTLDEHLSGDPDKELLASQLVPLVLKTAFFKVVNFLDEKLTGNEIDKLITNEELRFLTHQYGSSKLTDEEINQYGSSKLTDEEIKKYFILSLVTMVTKSEDFIRDDLRNSNSEPLKPSHWSNLKMKLAAELTSLNDDFGQNLTISEFEKRVAPADNIFKALEKTANSNLPLKEKITLYEIINERARGFGTDDNTAFYSFDHITKQMKTYKQSATGYGGLALLSAAVAVLGGVLVQHADCIEPGDLFVPKAFDFSNFFDGHSDVAQWCHSPGGLVILGVIFAAGVFAGYQAYVDTQTRRTFEDLMGPVGHLDVSQNN